MTVWASYDSWAVPALLVLLALFVWLIVWDIRTQAKRWGRYGRLTVERNLRGDEDVLWELFRCFYARRAREIAFERDTHGLVRRVELHSVRVPEAVQS